jgi:hypothetical protein
LFCFVYFMLGLTPCMLGAWGWRAGFSGKFNIDPSI